MIKIYYMECDDEMLYNFYFDYMNDDSSSCAYIERGSGYEWCKTEYFFLKSFGGIEVVLTNDLDILEYGKDDAWDEEKERFEIYLYDVETKKFVNIHEACDAGIRRAHNIRKLYISGAIRIE